MESDLRIKIEHSKRLRQKQVPIYLQYSSASVENLVPMSLIIKGNKNVILLQYLILLSFLCHQSP